MIRDLRGRRPAGFRFTPSGESEWTLALDWPLHIPPGGGLGHTRRRFRNLVQPLDRSYPPEPWTVGASGQVIDAVLRYQSYPAELMDALEASLDGLQLDYYPRLDAANWFFPVRVIGIGEELSVEEDRTRHAYGAYEMRKLRLLHLANGTGNCGDSFQQLLTGNLLLSPRLARDSDGDGIADDWNAFASSGGAGTRSAAERGQEFTLSAAGAAGEQWGVLQDVSGGLEGDVYHFSGEAKIAAITGSCALNVYAAAQGGGSYQGTLLNQIFSAVSAWFAFEFEFAPLPAAATSLRVIPFLRSGAAGDAGTALVRDLRLELLGEA